MQSPEFLQSFVFMHITGLLSDISKKGRPCAAISFGYNAYKLLLSCAAPIGEDTVIVREGSENRMMEASSDLYELPHIRQLFLYDPQLLIMKLQHVTTFVNTIIIGSTYQRVSKTLVFCIC